MEVRWALENIVEKVIVHHDQCVLLLVFMNGSPQRKQLLFDQVELSRRLQQVIDHKRTQRLLGFRSYKLRHVALNLEAQLIKFHDSRLLNQLLRRLLNHEASVLYSPEEVVSKRELVISMPDVIYLLGALVLVSHIYFLIQIN